MTSDPGWIDAQNDTIVAVAALAAAEADAVATVEAAHSAEMTVRASERAATVSAAAAAEAAAALAVRLAGLRARLRNDPAIRVAEIHAVGSDSNIRDGELAGNELIAARSADEVFDSTPAADPSH